MTPHTIDQLMSDLSAMSNAWDRAAEALRQRDIAQCERELARFKAIQKGAGVSRTSARS